MLAGLASCFVVRVYMIATPATRKGWLVEVAVTALSLMFTAGAIVTQRPAPFFALLLGTGLGALGAGIIRIAVKYVAKMDAFGEAEPDVDDHEAIRRLSEQIKDLK
jgi:NaMN:DMB phosphoribosyltransferase